MPNKPRLIGIQKLSEMYELYHVRPEDWSQYKVLFFAYGSSSYGELVDSFGLLEKAGKLYAIYGSECSVWDFNGQFQPERITIEELKHHFSRGRLGLTDDGTDRYRKAFLEFLPIVEERFGAGNRLALADKVGEKREGDLPGVSLLTEQDPALSVAGDFFGAADRGAFESDLPAYLSAMTPLQREPSPHLKIRVDGADLYIVPQRINCVGDAVLTGPWRIGVAADSLKKPDFINWFYGACEVLAESAKAQQPYFDPADQGPPCEF